MSTQVREWLKAVGAFLRSVLLLNLTAASLTAFIYWWRQDLTRDSVGEVLMAAAAALAFLAMAGVMGEAKVARNPNYRYAQSVMPNTLHQRTRQVMDDLAGGMDFALRAGVAALMSFAASLLLSG